MNLPMSEQTLPSSQNLGSVMQQKILLVEQEAEHQDSLNQKLISQGICPAKLLSDTHGLLAAVTSSEAELLILSVNVLDNHALEQLVHIKKNAPLPVIIFAQQHFPEVVKTVVNAGVSSYIVDKVEAKRLPVILDLALARFSQMHSLSLELKKTKEKLVERKLLEKAKGILMQQNQLSEDQAYVQMRKAAMNQSLSMGELAKRIIDVFEMQ